MSKVYHDDEWRRQIPSKKVPPTRAKEQERIDRSPLCDRIRAAWKPRIGYHELMSAVFPYEEYPLAWRYSHNGGPPVCAMAFGKALRKLGLMRYDNHISGTPNEEVTESQPGAGLAK